MALNTSPPGRRADRAAPGKVNCVKAPGSTGVGAAAASPPQSERRPTAGAGAQAPRRKGLLLCGHAVVAERRGFNNSEVLSRSPSFLTGVERLAVPANYGTLDRAMRLSAVHRRKIMELREEESHALSAKMDVGGC